MVHAVATTPLKDQQSSGTCWSFATTSFLETEAVRLGREPVVLSPIYFVPPTYMQKAERFIESKGRSYFGAGDLTFSVLSAYEALGAVPEAVYDGIIEGDSRHDHLEMDNLLEAMVKSVGTSGYGRIKPSAWRESVRAVLIAYLGAPPSTFEFRGSTYSPRTFADEYVGIEPAAYVEVTSFVHLPAPRMVVLDIPANWRRRTYLNVSFSDFARIIDRALRSGFSLAWDGDASEPGFRHSDGSARLSADEERGPVTASTRQHGFEQGATTDDHNMHLVSLAVDNDGTPYYVFKNSEGPNARGGYIYMSRNYLLMKTISVLVHRDALPLDLRRHVAVDGR